MRAVELARCRATGLTLFTGSTDRIGLMKTVRVLICGFVLFALQGLCGLLCAAETVDGLQVATMAGQTVNNDNTTVQVSAPYQPKPPAFLEHLVDTVLGWFGQPATGANTLTHYAISALFLVGAFLLRHVVTNVIFRILKKFTERTESTLDDKLLPVMEAPVAAFITIVGIFASLNVLKLSPVVERAVDYGSTVAFSLVLFWGLLRAFNAVLDHANEIAIKNQMGIAAFMPWIKKTLVTAFVVIGLLLVIQSLGYNVSTFLQGLGIGGLAFALAAQDTIANLFGSLVVATDQPFKIGETIRVAGSTGMVEDIGLRSTKLRLTDKSLVVIPNKTMASELIVNLSRFTQRRVEQTIGLTYDTTAEQMELILADLRTLLTSEEGIAYDSVDVYFTDYADSSLNIQIVYHAASPDYRKSIQLRERMNLKMMRAVAARGLSFAFPTRTVVLDGPVAKQLVAKKD